MCTFVSPCFCMLEKLYCILLLCMAMVFSRGLLLLWGLVKGPPSVIHHLCAILCLKNVFCWKEPFVLTVQHFKSYSQDSLVFANVTNTFAELRIHQVTLRAWLPLLNCCLYQGKWITYFLFCCTRGDGLILVLNMLLQTWLLLLFCEAVLINWAVKLYSSVKWRSSLSQCLSVLPSRRASCFWPMFYLLLTSVLLYALVVYHALFN